ncbi:hypothetical protein [Bartonella taylorii]|uniref:hypothetical protein n=1 Tax=Bartonella taylorii TaxID=33046 RepID=UPI001ABA7939
MGQTIAHVQDALRSRGDYTREHENSKGISIIQVYGTADKDSFQLNGCYVMLRGSPYQYCLRAYGLSSSLGERIHLKECLRVKKHFGISA